MPRMVQEEWLRRNSAILSHGGTLSNPNSRYYTGTPLLHALIKYPQLNFNKLKCVSKLVEQGADPNILNSEGQSPAMIAARHGEDDILKLLFEIGEVGVEAEDRRGNTALSHGVLSGKTSTVLLLIRTLNLHRLPRLLLHRNCEGMNPVDIAHQHQHLHLATIIMEEQERHRQTLAPNLTRQSFLCLNSSYPPRSYTKSQEVPEVPRAAWVYLPSTNNPGGHGEGMRKQVAVVQQVHVARQRFLSVLGVFKDKKNTQVPSKNILPRRS